MEMNEIRKANRKALPKFILLMIISLIAGGVIGYFSARFSLGSLAGGLKSAGAFFGSNVAPWLMFAIAVIDPIVSLSLYGSAKKLFSPWDEEDEEVADTVERKLSIVLWITSAALTLSFFLIAAVYSGGLAAFEDKASAVLLLASVVAFLGILAETVLIQQKCVDATKLLHPEKKGSIYDMKFHKKWLDSCDEAEKIMIGKCAYKSYSLTNTVCAFLAIVLAICALFFDIGFLPSFAVCLIWIVNQSAYCQEAIRYSKAGNKIS